MTQLKQSCKIKETTTTKLSKYTRTVWRHVGSRRHAKLTKLTWFMLGLLDVTLSLFKIENIKNSFTSAYSLPKIWHDVCHVDIDSSGITLKVLFQYQTEHFQNRIRRSYETIERATYSSHWNKSVQISYRQEVTLATLLFSLNIWHVQVQ